MKYLETYQLFEAETRQAVTDEIVNALENTPEGKDLLALTTSPRWVKEYYPEDSLVHQKYKDAYIPRRTGRVELKNLRGKTYITQLNNGKWYHAVEATGRIYGEGTYDSLTECIRGVWRGFIMDSTSIIPRAMPKKLYKEFLDKALPDLIGKEFTQDQIRDHLKVVYSGGVKMMDYTSPIFSSPRWVQIFDFLGLKKDLHPVTDGSLSSISVGIDYNSESIFQIMSRSLLTYEKETGIYRGATYNHNLQQLRILFYPYKKKLSKVMWGLEVGDSIEKTKEIETIAAKLFIESNLPTENSYWLGTSDGTGILQSLIINFALEIFTKGMEGENEIEINMDAFNTDFANSIVKLDPSPSTLNSIRNNLPLVWKEITGMQGEDAEALNTAADLGDLGF